MLADKPFGEWNTFRIVQVGARDERLPERQARRRPRQHGKLLADRTARRSCRSGPIQLQTHGGEIRWRNIFVREIGRGRGQRDPRRSTATTGFKPIFNGKDLDGWAGRGRELRGHRRRDRLQAGQGRRRSTRQDEFGDFVARVEFKLPPGGNNGLAIRYPGKGRHRLRRHVRAPGARRRRRASTPSSTRASPTARPTAWSPRSAATCARSASGTSRR